MRTISARGRVAIAVLVLLAGVPAAWGSSATFVITGHGITLGAAKDVEGGAEQPLRFHARATVGKPFTLTAQGVVLPRGGKAQPGEPDAGAWTFDGKRFKAVAPAARADKTKVVIRLEPTAPGPSHIRFTGTILGYERVFEVLVEVAER